MEVSDQRDENPKDAMNFSDIILNSAGHRNDVAEAEYLVRGKAELWAHIWVFCFCRCRLMQAIQ